MWLYYRVMSPNDADRMANSVDLDQTSPLGMFLTFAFDFIWQLSLVTRKPVFGVCDQVRLKPACSVIEASKGHEIANIETRDIILSRQRTTKVLIRLRVCAGLSAALLFAYGEKQVFSWHGSTNDFVIFYFKMLWQMFLSVPWSGSARFTGNSASQDLILNPVKQKRWVGGEMNQDIFSQVNTHLMYFSVSTDNISGWGRSSRQSVW